MIRASLSRSGSASSETPMIAEFLIIAMIKLPSGGMTVRNACGSTIRRIVSRSVNPSESDASIWPLLTEKTPDRSTSAT